MNRDPNAAAINALVSNAKVEEYVVAVLEGHARKLNL